MGVALGKILFLETRVFLHATHELREIHLDAQQPKHSGLEARHLPLNAPHQMYEFVSKPIWSTAAAGCPL